MQTLGLITVVMVALGFAYTNGFHDSANAIATSVSTRALTPRAALVMAGVMNLVGAYVGLKLGGGVTKSIVNGIIATPPKGAGGLVVVFALLAGAILWNLITWYFGLPSSSSHALIGGMVGAGLAAGLTVHWGGVWSKVVLPMLVSPMVGFVLAFALMVAILWGFRRRRPGPVTRGFRMSQTVSAAGMALGHGIQDAQKTMGVVMLALIAGGHATNKSPVPWWALLTTALSISLGTYAGGWRIMRTLGRRIIELDPPRGFAAETVASLVLYFTAFIYPAPVSTTHIITGSIMGAGATRGRNAVRWGVAKNIVYAWCMTIPAAAVCAAAVYYVVHPIFV
ncbi:inorganic phosphate transporter [Actinocrinis puniceicyclus]|uniref:Inorganic phosphate transporter n=1 Tax=Actinocrinis puniceicyclus TaxID=977794 RepID=A0A8J7WHG6_9ACTN|nr:inorganic phosphate transporter [Actinocrinis puniceicyclus]MBS2962278.1 inorganic phosphate transporter [Actinocrinis puniceicyclus]